MLRVLLNITSTQSCYNISANPVCVQCVRWRRKPRWMPTAKSKLFRVPERKVQDEDERLELLRLHNNYRTQMRSLRSYFAEENRRNSEISTADHLIVTPEEEAAELQELQKINNEWNAKCEEIRNVRLQRQAEEERELILQRLEAKELKDEEERQQADELVRLEKERSKTFINHDNLDKAIEYALANPVDVNFAIDIRENIIHGRMTPAPASTTKSEKVVAIASSS